MLKLCAIIAYVVLVIGLKTTSMDLEERYHRIPESMARLSRRAFIKREDAIEMAIWCNASFWLLLLPATVILPTPEFSTEDTDWLLFWGLKLWIWVGSALSVVPFYKGTRYIIGVRPTYMKELAALVAEDSKHDSEVPTK